MLRLVSQNPNRKVKMCLKGQNMDSGYQNVQNLGILGLLGFLDSFELIKNQKNNILVFKRIL